MIDFLKYSGNILAIMGLAICLLTGLSRVFGSFYIFGYEAKTLFVGGTAILVAACLAKLQLILIESKS